MRKIQYLLLVGSILLTVACKKQPAEVIPLFQQHFTQSEDIGSPTLPGNFSFNDTTGVYTLSGSGENIWSKSDQFFYVYEPVDSDFSLSSKVVFAPTPFFNSHPHRKIGLMIRETLESTSPYADITVHFADGLTSLQYRPAIDADTEEKQLDILGADSLVLERIAGKIIVKAICSGEATSAEAQSEIELNLPASCYIGLFICSHDSTIQETAYFSSVKLTK